jgi:hypothetical protein
MQLADAFEAATEETHPEASRQFEEARPGRLMGQRGGRGASPRAQSYDPGPGGAIRGRDPRVMKALSCGLERPFHGVPYPPREGYLTA